MMKMASAKSSRKVMASSSRLPVQRAQKIFKTSWHLVEGRTCIDIGRWQVYQFGPQNWAGGRFAGLGLKTGGTAGAA